MDRNERVVGRRRGTAQAGKDDPTVGVNVHYNHHDVGGPYVRAVYHPSNRTAKYGYVHEAYFAFAVEPSDNSAGGVTFFLTPEQMRQLVEDVAHIAREFEQELLPEHNGVPLDGVPGIRLIDRNGHVVVG